MAKLTYTAIASLDGYIEDREGKFDWGMPDGEVHSFVNDLARSAGTYLYGRRLYETMQAWDSDEAMAGHPDFILDFAQIWRAADKVVYSRTLEEVSTTRTTLERDFDPAAVARLKETAENEITVGGAELAAEAIRAGLVDEISLILAPALVGGGKPALSTDSRLDLTLLDEHRFASGFVYLHYAVGS